MELFYKGKNNFSYFGEVEGKKEVLLCKPEDTIEVTEEEYRRLLALLGDDIKVIGSAKENPKVDAEEDEMPKRGRNK